MKTHTSTLEFIGALTFLSVIFGGGLACFAAWITHLVWTVKLLMNGSDVISQFILAFIGAFIPPVGVIHGFVLWFT